MKIEVNISDFLLEINVKHLLGAKLNGSNKISKTFLSNGLCYYFTETEID